MSRPGELARLPKAGSGTKLSTVAAGRRKRSSGKRATYPTNQATDHGSKKVSIVSSHWGFARVGGLPEWATYTVESGRQLPDAGGEACSPEVGEPS